MHIGVGRYRIASAVKFRYCQPAETGGCRLRPQTLESFISNDMKGERQMNAEGADFSTEHNLRTSVTIIRAASEILSDHPDMPRGERQRFQDALVSESARLSRMIDEITARCSLDLAGGDCPERMFRQPNYR